MTTRGSLVELVEAEGRHGSKRLGRLASHVANAVGHAVFPVLNGLHTVRTRSSVASMGTRRPRSI